MGVQMTIFASVVLRPETDLRGAELSGLFPGCHTMTRAAFHTTMRAH